ncbi:hypothetical protein [Phytobacter ursingii]|uniref:Uncharacterized protein n=1 Tax=Phytobacter ursingii TaxID=1972431 RepID=A0AB35RUJ0_9ENTR|nr:hypothetical protein [Phytobacter ursingii]MDV2865633.1 hypothetical protein [Phytobacter ursingii]
MTAVVPLWVPVATALAGMGGALGSQFLSHYFAAGREKKAADKKLASERAYIGSQLMIILAGYRVQCHEFSRFPVKDDVVLPRPKAPDFSRVKGDWTVLDGVLQLRIHRLAFLRTQHNARLAAVHKEHGDGHAYLDVAFDVYQKLVGECDGIIQALGTLCALPSPWSLDE